MFFRGRPMSKKAILRKGQLKYTDHWTETMWEEYEKLNTSKERHKWRYKNDEWFYFLTCKKRAVGMAEAKKRDPEKFRERNRRYAERVKKDPKKLEHRKKTEAKRYSDKKKKDPDYLKKQWAKTKEKMKLDPNFRERMLSYGKKRRASERGKEKEKEYRNRPEVKERQKKLRRISYRNYYAENKEDIRKKNRESMSRRIKNCDAYYCAQLLGLSPKTLRENPELLETKREQIKIHRQLRKQQQTK